ncbi:hypothetical protein DM15PD_01940 [Aristophania vespae]|nr:hypothetical protein DM15PD_01940 [Aristophania vespae]
MALQNVRVTGWFRPVFLELVVISLAQSATSFPDLKRERWFCQAGK